VAAAEQFLEAEEMDSGIVVGRGSELRFWHLTFQEFLAAKAIGGLPETEERSLLLGRGGAMRGPPGCPGARSRATPIRDRRCAVPGAAGASARDLRRRAIGLDAGRRADRGCRGPGAGWRSPAWPRQSGALGDDPGRRVS
jgi:hypothetical protein